MRPAVLVGVLAVLAFGGQSAAPASADIRTATIGDPVDEATNPLDIEQVRTSFDRGLGTITLTVRTYGAWPATPRQASTTYLSFTILQDDYEGCEGSYGTASSRGEASGSFGATSSYSTSPPTTTWRQATVSVQGQYESRSQSVEVSFSADRREVAIAFSDALLVDADNRCVSVSLSNGEGGVYNDPDKAGDGTSDSASGYFTGWSPDEIKANTDTDADGVSDLYDKCPNRAWRKADGTPTSDGCRDLTDSDGDGKYDDVDVCPAEYGKTGDGCAPPACRDKLDNDGDGQVDKRDLGCEDRFDNDERLGRLPQLTFGAARHWVDKALARKFGNAYRHGYVFRDGEESGPFIGRCRRIQQLKMSCATRWYIGDAGYHGRVTIWYTRAGEQVLWHYSYRIKLEDYYCKVTGGSNCTRTYVVT